MFLSGVAGVFLWRGVIVVTRPTLCFGIYERNKRVPADLMLLLETGSNSPDAIAVAQQCMLVPPMPRAGYEFMVAPLRRPIRDAN